MTKKAKNGKTKGTRDPSVKAAPSASTKIFRVTLPEEKTVSRGAGRMIRHREMIRTIPGSVAFSTTTIELNPGILASFPWLSTQACGWEFHHFSRLTLEYVTRSATTATGTIYVVPEYDPTDPPPASEVDALAAYGTVSTAPWASVKIPFDPGAMYPIGPRKYVRDASVAGDLRTSDVGVVHICTVGQAGTSDVGQIWADYEITFSVPQVCHTLGARGTTSIVSVNPLVLTTATPRVVDWPVLDPVFNGLRWPHALLGTSWTPPRGVYNFRFAADFRDTTYEVAQLILRQVVGGTATDLETETNQPTASGVMKTMDAAWSWAFDGLTALSFYVIATFTAGPMTCVKQRLMISAA